nr:ORF99 [Picosynechococcus sp. PCC 7002]
MALPYFKRRSPPPQFSRPKASSAIRPAKKPPLLTRLNRQNPRINRQPNPSILGRQKIQLTRLPQPFRHQGDRPLAAAIVPMSSPHQKQDPLQLKHQTPK